MGKSSGGNRVSRGGGNWGNTIADPDMRRQAIETREALAKVGISEDFLPKIEYTTIVSRKGTVTMAQYRDGRDVIEVNADSKAVRKGKEWQLSAVSSGYTTQPNTIMHEVSHKIHSTLEKELIQTARGYRASMTIGLLPKSTIKKSVSEYASTNSKEFHAELISGILSGRKYPKDILDDSILGVSENKVAKRLYRRGLQ